MALLGGLAGLHDPRIDRKKLYPLTELLFLTVNAVMCGYSEWDEIVDFGEAKLAWFRLYLPYENGISSHDTLNRAIGLLDCREFEVFFVSWMQGLADTLCGKLVDIDGKKLRSSVDKRLQQVAKKDGGKSAVHLVEAWCSELKLCLGQYKTEDKSNEITAIPALLDLLEIQGCLISIDAMGCQKDIAAKIIGKEADYLLGLKGNQEKVHIAVKGLFEQQGSFQTPDFQSDINHGRVENRYCRVLSANLLPEEIRKEWLGLGALIEIRSERVVLSVEGHCSVEYRYYLASRVESSEFYNKMVRGHWGIENQLHWSMDVQFGEDKSRKRAGNAAQNFALIRRLALNLLKTNHDKPKTSIKRRMNKCALSDDYRRNTLRF